MDQFSNFSEINLWTIQVLIVNLVIAVAMIAALRFISGLVANVKSGDELAEKDNFAFGIAFAGGIVALALMLTGVVSGEASQTIAAEGLSVLLYGVVGLFLIKIGRLIQDKIVLSNIAIQEEIKNKNLAAAFVDLGNTIAIGLVLRAVMSWVEAEMLTGVVIVLIAFVITQLILSLVTRYRLAVYSKRHSGASLQEAFAQGNVALAVRYTGHLLGVALAITAASGVVNFLPEALASSLIGWAIASLIFAVALSLLAVLVRKAVLHGINVVEEVDKQQNVGVACVEASVYLSIGLFIVALFSA